MGIKDSKRISVIGPSGSRKSTLAIELGGLLNLPVYHIDVIYYSKENCGRIPIEELLSKIEAITKTERWIIEGTYSQTLRNRFETSDKVIYLNIPFKDCVESVKRRFENKEPRIGVPENFEENHDFQTLLEKMESRRENRQALISTLHKEYPHKVIELKTFKEVKDFQDSLQF